MATKSATQRKKSTTQRRQSISSGAPRSYGEMYKNDQTRGVATTPAAAPRPATVAVQPQVDTENWAQEYDYVLRDLRTLGLVTGGLLAVIIIAGFFI